MNCPQHNAVLTLWMRKVWKLEDWRSMSMKTESADSELEWEEWLCQQQYWQLAMSCCHLHWIFLYLWLWPKIMVNEPLTLVWCWGHLLRSWSAYPVVSWSTQQKEIHILVLCNLAPIHVFSFKWCNCIWIVGKDSFISIATTLQAGSPGIKFQWR